jgi:signal transduction histidine kinase/DNA-binding response OmpR family regulator
MKENLYLLDAMLKGSGYDAVSAINGKEALEKLRAEEFDMIISDILMPVMDGFTLCRECKGDEKLKGIPFIFYTATYKDKRDEELALKLGADRYLLKPMEPEKLIAIIQGLFRDIGEGKIGPNKLVSGEEEETFKLYSERLINKLEKKMLDLESETTQRKIYAEKLERVNKILHAIRSINQLIVRENDRQRLIQATCDNLTKIGGYYNAWVALFDESGGLTATAEVGLGEDFLPIVQQLKRGDSVTCAQQALKQAGVIVIKDPLSTCSNCPLAKHYSGRGGIAIRFEHDGKVYGLLVASVPVDLSEYEEEQSLIREVAGDIAFALCNMEKEEERKQEEKEKQQLEEKAQVASRLAAVGEMVAGVAHEINNPLTSVLGFSQMILEKENVPEDIRENLKLIADGSQRVADIVKRLLTFSRQAKPVKTIANLNKVIDNTLKLREYVLKTANIEVVTRFDTELPWSVVDPGQMQQVFLNMIVNAEQAMKEAHGKGTLTITTEKKGNSIRMSFQDDGSGITKENLGRMFQPFFTTKAPGEGTGLGLSLSRSIILEHGGTMSVESKAGHGATFIIDLPIIESLLSEDDTLSPVAKVKPDATKKGKILVIDDEPGVRALLEKVLTQSGHSVDTVSDAGKALDKLGAGETYDVILTDVRMPGMNGIELYSRILEKTPAMKNKIIFITGDVMGLDIKAFLTQNNLSYLAKPFDTPLLKEKIEIIMAGQPENNNPNRSSK